MAQTVKDRFSMGAFINQTPWEMCHLLLPYCIFLGTYPRCSLCMGYFFVSYLAFRPKGLNQRWFWLNIVIVNVGHFRRTHWMDELPRILLPSVKSAGGLSWLQILQSSLRCPEVITCSYVLLPGRINLLRKLTSLGCWILRVFWHVMSVPKASGW